MALIDDMDKVTVDGVANSTPQSRGEAILLNTINGEEDTGKVVVDGDHESMVPQSRMEALLRQIPGGGGGGITEARVRELIGFAVDDLVDNAPSDADTLKKLNDKILQTGSMYYQYITLAPTDLVASSTYSDFPYEYNLTYTGVSETDFTEMSIEDLNYNGSYMVKSATNKTILYFSELPTSNLRMYVYANIAKTYSPQSSAVYTVEQINELFGIGKEETTNTASYAHPKDEIFIWNGDPYRATTNIAVGDTISSANTVQEHALENYYTKDEINTQMGYDGVEETAVASKSHSSGDFFLWQGTPAKAIADIAQGATIAAGTNIEMASVFGELSKVLGTRDVQGFRYYVEISSLSASIDNVKSVLEKYATAPYVNLQGVSIVNIRFATAGQVLAILSHYQSGGFAALVYGFNYSYVPPYYLYYSGGVWTDILLASGQISASSIELVNTLPYYKWTSVRSIELTKGVWTLNACVSFANNSIGPKGILLSYAKDSGNNIGAYNLISTNDSVPTALSLSFTMNINNPTTIYINAWQRTDVTSISISSVVNAYRLS